LLTISHPQESVKSLKTNGPKQTPKSSSKLVKSRQNRPYPIDSKQFPTTLHFVAATTGKPLIPNETHTRNPLRPKFRHRQNSSIIVKTRQNRRHLVPCHGFLAQFRHAIALGPNRNSRVPWPSRAMQTFTRIYILST
jgi:hypothetical protein